MVVSSLTENETVNMFRENLSFKPTCKVNPNVSLDGKSRTKHESKRGTTANKDKKEDNCKYKS